jgi:uncharacterized DUF497 family protein
LKDCSLDFDRAAEVFYGCHVTLTDNRFDYGEGRHVTAGLLDGRMAVLVWTPRGTRRRIISMRKTNAREQSLYEKYIDAS